ncbi:carboxypeptidase regulatory-like domain-containing protein [Larkinella harenae]
MCKRLLWFQMVVVAFVLIFSVFDSHKALAQVTNSSINGLITDDKGEGLPGATVKATHVPSGTVYGTTTQNTGRFTIPGMRTGGPYTVEITFVGFEPKVVQNITLVLGEPYVLNQKLGESSQQLAEIQVVASNSILNNERTGASTNINARQLTSLPTISRSLTDFTRLTPQANGTGFAGRDPRLNNVRIDGATFSNGFGLSNDLLPGGDAQPISLDAIEEVQVNVAPYDVRQSNFTGAGINAITRSGTNQLTGSAYGFYRDQSFNGTKVAGVALPEQSKSSNKVYGARLGGALIKNKLFFFANFERENYVFPGNVWVANRGDNAGRPGVARTTVADLEAVSAHLKSKYGYDPGAYENYANQYANLSTKFLGRLDWNISNKHKLTLRYNQVVGTSDAGTNNNSGPNPRSSANRISSESISFENANYALKNVVRSVTAELNSNFSSKLSNQFLATYSYIESTRSTPGSLFPFVDIWEDGRNYMSFGTELFSYNNGLKNSNFSFIDNLTYQAGKHTITAGASFEIMNFDNSYVRMGTSYYRFNSVQDFLNDRAPSVYGVTYPFQSDTWAKVKFGLAGLYAQDRIAINERLNTTIGLRVDMPLFLDKPLNNPAIDALRLLDQNGNETTFNTTRWPKSRPLFSPRVGVNYDVFGDRTLQVRGGTGIFTGLIPFVWFTNMPTNSGVLQNTFEPVNAATLAEITSLNADPYYWVNRLPNRFPKTPGANAPGTVALVDPEFRMPQVFRTNIGADYKIPGTPLVASFDLIYTKDINATYQYNANRKRATQTLNYSGDNRDFWNGTANATYNPATGPIVPVLSNTSKGHSVAATLGVSLPARRGLYGSFFYNYTAAKDVTGNPGSAANSAWSNNYSINDPNELLLGQSQYALPHRLVGNLSYRFEYIKHLATTVSLFYQGTSAGRFAYTYNGDINRDGVSLDLLYVPNSSSELNFVDIVSGGTVRFTAQQQREAYDRFVENVPALKAAKGGYVERNSGILPWFHRFDFRLLQDVFTNVGPRRHSLQFSVDITNAGNLLNSNWGIRQELNSGSLYNYALLNVAGVTAAGVPSFNMITINQNNQTILPTTPYRNYFDIANTWRMQLGLRYNF